jgi:uncharacterized RDD family membrane protein YckC
MKCPKCGYLGFETVDRCRNCGYDFSLTTPADTTAELPLHSREGAGTPFADFDLSLPEPSREADSNLDLDRLIGTSSESPAPAAAGAPVAATDAPPSEEEADSRPAPRAVAGPASKGLPLFSPPHTESDDTPLISAPRPVRPPLSVRRSTPDIPRVRPRATRKRSDAAELNFQIDAAIAEASDDVASPPTMARPEQASRVARLAAMLIDVGLLGGIDAAVIYLTLAIAGLTFTLADVAVLPIVPTAAFLLLLNGGYVVAFTLAGGQTIGKMLTGIRVTSDDGTRLDAGRAVLRAAGCLLSLLTAGLGYFPAFFSTDARALQDRLAGTRVVRAG